MVNAPLLLRASRRACGCVPLYAPSWTPPPGRLLDASWTPPGRLLLDASWTPPPGRFLVVPQCRPAVPSRSAIPQCRPAVPSCSAVPQCRPAVLAGDDGCCSSDGDLFVGRGCCLCKSVTWPQCQGPYCAVAVEGVPQSMWVRAVVRTLLDAPSSTHPPGRTLIHAPSWTQGASSYFRNISYLVHDFVCYCNACVRCWSALLPA